MSTPVPDPSSDLTPEQRHEQVVAILARVVVRRVRLLRRSDASTDRNALAIPPDDLLIAEREILV